MTGTDEGAMRRLIAERVAAWAGSAVEAVPMDRPLADLGMASRDAIVLAGEGKHFSAGHDIGTPGRDVDVPFDRRAVLWWDHTDKVGGDQRFARESEVYLGMCRRWREIPKPMIASIQGACIAGGLMLALSRGVQMLKK